MDAHCGGTTTGADRMACEFTGSLYATGARVNSWLEHYEAPGHGVNGSYVFAVLALLALVLVPRVRRWRGRRLESGAPAASPRTPGVRRAQS